VNNLGKTIRSEFAHAMHGVEGRMMNAIGGTAPGTFSNQTFVTGWKEYRERGERLRIKATVRWDDQCRNGHNSFSITGIIDRYSGGRWQDDSGGCIHDQIAKHFPGLEPLIKWHLSSSDGPMHYEANTIYHAGDRDHWGTRKGEVRRYATVLRFGDNPIVHKPGKHKADAFIAFLETQAPQFDLEVLRHEHREHREAGKPGAYQFEPNYTLGAFGTGWHECPFDTEAEALAFLTALQTCNPQFIKVPVAWGEGKERQLDAARDAAVWPEATDAELCQEPEQLRAALRARLPALLVEMRAAIEGAGFLWGCPQ